MLSPGFSENQEKARKAKNLLFIPPFLLFVDFANGGRPYGNQASSLRRTLVRAKIANFRRLKRVNEVYSGSLNS